MADAAALELALDAEEPRPRPPAALLVPTDAPVLVLDTALQWSAIAACWLAMLKGPSWLYPLWALLVATRIHAFGVILHEACHMPPGRLGWAGRLVEVGAGYACASTIAAMRYHHLRHHRDSCMDSDPYRKPDLRGRPALLGLYWLRTVFILPAWVFRGFVGSIAYFVRSLRQPYGRYLLQDRSGEDLRDSPAVIACARAEWGQALVHAGALALAWRWPEALLWGYGVPALLASLLCGWRLLQEHTYERVDDRSVASILRSTRDHNLNWLGRLLFAPMNIGYHVSHHLHPQAAKDQLPALTRWYQEHMGGQYPTTRSWRQAT